MKCQGNLGIFASFDGQSTKPPLSWCENCCQFQISLPYVLCYNGDGIKVYNLLDSKLKQEISFSQARNFEFIDEENFFIISTPVQMFIINPISPNKQIEQLVGLHQVDEATRLFECLNKNLAPSDYEEVVRFEYFLHFVI